MVACVQHDSDKIISVVRSGVLAIQRLMYPAPASNGSKGIDLSRSVSTSVRMYVSSVVFNRDTMVADGFDNQVLAIFLNPSAGHGLPIRDEKMTGDNSEDSEDDYEDEED